MPLGSSSEAPVIRPGPSTCSSFLAFPDAVSSAVLVISASGSSSLNANLALSSRGVRNSGTVRRF
jgi:hypothetical protein